MSRRSWRDVIAVHPAADVFPMMSKEELRDLGNDIKKNGLKHGIVVWSEVMGSALGAPDGDMPSEKQHYVLDGRNRLAAMELVGMRTVTPEGDLAVNKEYVSAKCISAPMSLGSGKLGNFKERPGKVPDPAAYVISANVRRRHLSKKQQADLIVKVVESAGKETFAKLAKVSRGKRGPAKDLVKQKVIEEAKKNDISSRTAERALAEHRAPQAQGQPKRTFVTCLECSGRTADIAKHMATKHKGKKPAVAPRERPLKRTRKQAISSLKKMAIDADCIASPFDIALGDLPTLASYPEAGEWIDMLADASRRLAVHTRRLTRERDAVVAVKS